MGFFKRRRERKEAKRRAKAIGILDRQIAMLGIGKEYVKAGKATYVGVKGGYPQFKRKK